MKKLYSILAVAAMATVANAQTNLVQNPGFENWTGDKPDNWFTSGITFEKSESIKNGGNSSIAVTSKTNNKGENYTSSLGAKDISIIAGKTYVFSGWYLDNDNKAEFKHWGQWRDSSSKLITDNSLQQKNASVDSPEWKRFEIEATAPSDATVARLSLRVYRNMETNEVGGKIYFDDVSFVEKSTLSVSDSKSLENSVKFNTIVEDKLTLFTPEKVTVNVYSLDGRLVSSNRISNGESVNFAGVQKGNYIVVVDNGHSKISKKIIKK